MIRYLVRRLGHAALLLFGISILLFVLMQAAPGDYLSEMKLNPQVSRETVHALEHQYGLDRPLPVRYVHWVLSAARGDFGYSFAYNQPAAKLIWPRVSNTLLLTLPALLISWLIAVPLGVFAASRKGGWIDRLFSTGTSTLLAVPDVLLALLALVLALKSRAFPVGGMRSLGEASSSPAIDLAWHLVLPVSLLVLGSLAVILRHVRASVAEVLVSSYIRAAEGHGVTRRKLLFSHALRAAANPLVSLFGLSVAVLLSGSLLVEVVMSWPGLGPMLLEAILARDVFVVIGAVMLSAVLLVVGGLLADLLLYALDPRIRVQA